VDIQENVFVTFPEFYDANEIRASASAEMKKIIIVQTFYDKTLNKIKFQPIQSNEALDLSVDVFPFKEGANLDEFAVAYIKNGVKSKVSAMNFK
jgi:hypothetical protein